MTARMRVFTAACHYLLVSSLTTISFAMPSASTATYGYDGHHESIISPKVVLINMVGPFSHLPHPSFHIYIPSKIPPSKKRNQPSWAHHWTTVTIYYSLHRKERFGTKGQNSICSKKISQFPVYRLYSQTSIAPPTMTYARSLQERPVCIYFFYF